MTVRRTDITQIALELRRAGELLLTPCPCTHTGYRWLTAHTLGEHLYDSTRNMAPGIQAQAFEPRTTTPGHTHDEDRDPPPDPDLHGRYLNITADAWATVRQLQTFIDSWRPDRTAPTGPTFTDTEWCAHHLDTLGTCEPRYRGDLCRRCYGVHLTTGHRPPTTILRAWQDGTRITDAMITAAIHAENPKTKGKRAKRKKAS